MVKELEVFNALCRWVDHERRCRQKHACNLLQHVRLQLVIYFFLSMLLYYFSSLFYLSPFPLNFIFFFNFIFFILNLFHSFLTCILFVLHLLFYFIFFSIHVFNIYNKYRTRQIEPEDLATKVETVDFIFSADQMNQCRIQLSDAWKYHALRCSGNSTLVKTFSGKGSITRIPGKFRKR